MSLEIEAVEQPLMRLNGLEFELRPDAEKLRDEALEASSLMAVVSSPATNQMAFNAQAAILGMIRAVQKLQKEIKDPLNRLRATIDEKAEAYLNPLREEATRLGRLMGDYHALEERKRIAAQEEKRKELEQIERAKQREIAQAQTLEQVDEIRERYQEKAGMVVAPPPVEKPSAQLVMTDWEIEVTDIWTLLRVHPNCVKIEPRLREIKEILNKGFPVAGIKAKQVTKTSARTG